MSPHTSVARCVPALITLLAAAGVLTGTPPSLGSLDGEKQQAERLTPPKDRPVPTFKIDPRTPAWDLIPAAPEGKRLAPVYLGDDLARVPVVVFEGAPENVRTTDDWTKHTAHHLAKADHLNGRARDGFIKTLIQERRDLIGLPFLLGDDCRAPSDRGVMFMEIAGAVRRSGESWDALRKVFDRMDAKLPRLARAHAELAREAGVSAVTQIMAEASAEGRVGLVKHLSGVPRVQATRELARLAVFSNEKAVRSAAVEALSVRRERDYTDVLTAALRYPWPAVARNAADAILTLDRKDLLGELVAVLEEPDPRLPRDDLVDNRRVIVTREPVRINHHRSCLLCHAPADPAKVRSELLAEVPLPSEELPTPSRGYNQRNSGLVIRTDMTYLRQDFSVMQTVKDADPWPEMQRFDFLVRKRILSDEEVKSLREKLTLKEEGELSPYHKAAVKALRELTGRDLPAKADAWRKHLKLPAKTG